MNEQLPKEKSDIRTSKERLAELIEDRQRFVTFLEVGDGDPDLADALNMARDMVAALKQLQSAHEPQPAASKKMVDGVLGCADHGCVFGHPGGMGTNGGCHCLSDVRPPALRRRVVKNVQLLRAEIERLQRDVYLLRNERDNLVDNVHRLTHEPPAECDGCDQYAVMHAEIALALDIHDETDAHGLQELILKKLRAMAEPTWPHPYGYIRSLISEAAERAEADLIAVGHSQDGSERAAAMRDLENWKAKLQDAWIHGDLEVRRATQPPEAKCEWGYDAGDDVWHTGCGQMHVFNIDGPTGNDYKWCPYCRKPIDDLSQSSPTKSYDCIGCGEADVPTPSTYCEECHQAHQRIDASSQGERND